MEEKILVKGEGVVQEIIGESLFDCVDTAYRRYKGLRVELILVRPIGYIDGKDLMVEDRYMGRHSVKEIMGSGSVK